MYASDHLQSFLFEHAPIRGAIAHLDNTYTAILQQRPYPHVIKRLLGEALVACALLSSVLKFEGELSIQFKGDGPFSLLIAQCDHLLNVRAFAKYLPDQDEAEYTQAFLKGQLIFSVNPYQRTGAYQSIVTMTSDSMAENLMNYFAQSEQISTKIVIATNETSVAGMLLQLLPDQDSLNHETFWEYASIIGDTIQAQELLTLSNEDLLHRLYHETTLRLFENRKLQFQCRCSPEKMKQVLTILGEKEINTLLAEKGSITMHCDFCNTHYSFDAVDIAALFHATNPPSKI